MKDQNQLGEYELDSEVNLEDYSITLGLMDKNKEFIQVCVGLSVVKKMRILLKNQIMDNKPTKYQKIDWLCLIYIGYLILYYW